MRSFLTTAAAAALITLTPACATAEQSFEEANPGTYNLEKTHAFVTWRVSHKGLSMYQGNFTDFDATIQFDPADPVASSVTATINPMGVETNYPNAEKKAEWHEELSMDFFKAEDFPEIKYVSTGIEKTGDFTGKLTGDLTFLGVTKPVTLDVTYNGPEMHRGLATAI